MAEMDDVFKALADPSRRLLLDSLNARNGQSLRELCAGLSMARQSVSKHLAVLEAANLVTTVWRGREKLHYLNAEPINAIADRWINQYDRARVQTLADLKTALETESMSDRTEFVYTTYIRTTPERLWQAIIDPAFSHRYIGHAMVSDWKKGSTYAWEDHGLKIEHPEQVILESDPYRRLAFAFHTFVPELATAVEQLDEETVAKCAAERRSRVSFDLEPEGDHVKLTVIHDDFEPDSTVLKLISGGWPWKLSNLKTELERS
jgi:DNA-binding transcriptional ArsR family regulator